jgi:hypothetical protein
MLASHLQIDADPDPGPMYHFDEDPDLAYHFDADPYPNPAYHVDADPDSTFQFVRIQINKTDSHVGSYCAENRMFFSAKRLVNCLRVVITFC